VIVGTKTNAHSVRSQVGIASESDCFFEQFYRILRISDLEARIKTEKSGGVVREEAECGNDVLKLLARDRRSLDILPVKKRNKAVSEQRKVIVTSDFIVYKFASNALRCQRMG